MPTATQDHLEQKWAQINDQPGIVLVDQEYLVNHDGSLRLEIYRTTKGVEFIYVNPANEPVVEPEVRLGLVDIEFGHTNGYTIITFVFLNKGWWSGLRLHSKSLHFNSRGPYHSCPTLMASFGRADSGKGSTGSS